MISEQAAATRLPVSLKPLWVCIPAVLAASTLLPLAGEGLLQNTLSHVPSAITSVPDNGQANDINDEQAKKQDPEAATAARKKQIADDSAKLLKLATDLKAEVDKTNKDTLSLNVIRKADEIERLARSVREKMKLTVGAS